MQEEREVYGVEEKCRAVLLVLTGRRTSAQVCREMKRSDGLFWQWQDRALSGMLEALEPRGARESAQGPALPDAVRRLLDRKVRVRELALVGRRAAARSRTPPAASAPAAGSG